MLDRRVRKLTRGTLEAGARALITLGFQADRVTWLGFSLGLCALPLIATHHAVWAILFILANRLADGLDGTIARMTKPSDRGNAVHLRFFFEITDGIAFW